MTPPQPASSRPGSSRAPAASGGFAKNLVIERLHQEFYEIYLEFIRKKFYQIYKIIIKKMKENEKFIKKYKNPKKIENFHKRN
ncbi:hypothetical protein [Paenibacillus abyssi]|uniref:Uncharacterized protein n=1 Tax=Paenibacillus abyssi TaxID=1340531 RepID=A0A917G244_9BACL|nr:hypothetical protein [Paenibacillus abyssi]GGG18741.1 hypothetical protein GCM10010916_39410 [Paenibacillus abyssi]